MPSEKCLYWDFLLSCKWSRDVAWHSVMYNLFVWLYYCLLQLPSYIVKWVHRNFTPTDFDSIRRQFHLLYIAIEITRCQYVPSALDDDRKIYIPCVMKIVPRRRAIYHHLIAQFWLGNVHELLAIDLVLSYWIIGSSSMVVSISCQPPEKYSFEFQCPRRVSTECDSRQGVLYVLHMT